MRLIDKDELKIKMETLDGRARVNSVMDLIEELPEISPYKELKTGTWERVSYLKCSQCGGEWDTEGDSAPKYCPMCGADMREKESEE